LPGGQDALLGMEGVVARLLNPGSGTFASINGAVLDVKQIGGGAKFLALDLPLKSIDCCGGEISGSFDVLFTDTTTNVFARKKLKIYYSAKVEKCGVVSERSVTLDSSKAGPGSKPIIINENQQIK